MQERILSFSPVAVFACGTRHFGDLTFEKLLAEDVVLAIELPLIEKLYPVNQLLDDPAVSPLVVGPFTAWAAAALPAVALLVILPSSDELGAQVGQLLEGVIDEFCGFSGGGEIGNYAPFHEGTLRLGGGGLGYVYDPDGAASTSLLVQKVGENGGYGGRARPGMQGAGFPGRRPG